MNFLQEMPPLWAPATECEKRLPYTRLDQLNIYLVQFLCKKQLSLS